MLGRARFDPRPRSEARYRASRRFLRDAFATWSTKAGSELGPDSFEELIHYKWGHLDGHLTCWREGDLDTVLLELFPAKVIVEDAELDNVIPEAKTFIAFLADSGLLDPASDDPEQLCSHLEKITGRFRRRMADQARYSPGKRFWLAAAAAGVDVDDDEAVSTFVERFNARPDADRAAVLGQRGKLPPTARRGGRITPAGTQPLPMRSRRRRPR
ncbi:MAG: hypothetical protein ACRDPG_04500 [Nocardioidaceae bacterium]